VLGVPTWTEPSGTTLALHSALRSMIEWKYMKPLCRVAYWSAGWVAVAGEVAGDVGPKVVDASSFSSSTTKMCLIAPSRNAARAA
jgi:hypothetical protein